MELQYHRAWTSRIVILLIVCAAGYNLNRFRRETAVDRSYDNIQAFDRSMQPLRRALPKAGTVGFINPAPDGAANGDDTKAYYLTQYALAPLVVVRGAAPEYVIGIFSDGLPPRDSIRGLLLVADFGNGVLLFRKKPE